MRKKIELTKELRQEYIDLYKPKYSKSDVERMFVEFSRGEYEVLHKLLYK